MKRRSFCSALLLGSYRVFAQAADDDDHYRSPTLSAKELDDVFVSDSEPNYEIDDPDLLGISREEFESYASMLEKGTVKASWASDDESIDYRHLETSQKPVGFELTATTLQSLAEANQFLPRIASTDLVLFGLRGCEILSIDRPNQKITLAESTPDHMNFRCTIGVWSRNSGKIEVFKASTVPNAVYMEVQRRGLEGCNLLPTGLHIYQTGTHGKSFGPTRKQPGALLQTTGVAVLRARSGLKYTTREAWDPMPQAPGYPSDNIHAAVIDGRIKGPFFSSKGCQVLPGAYEPAGQRPRGEWAKFRIAAGLTSNPANIVGENGRRFPYMLLTGREARLASSDRHEAAKLARLRFGSTGGSVRALRQKLGIEPSDDFDQKTMWAFIQWQRAKFGWADAVVAKDHLAALGL